MSAKIKVLPDHLVNQIAAGEVVENAASAVKELIENALDAGARRVVVSLENGGYEILSVTDDGLGMTPDDAVLCFQRHATSKIRSLEDLGKLATMGFRGEALAALAAVSKVTLTTRAEHQEEGTKVEIAGGRLLSATVHGRSPGTTIEVRNLFYNMAARRKFQPSRNVSQRDVLRILTAFSLGYPQVEFVLHSEGVEKIYAKKAEGQWECAIKIRLQDMLGEDCLVFDRPIHKEKMGYSIDGFVSAPGNHRANRSGQYLFVQGRYVFSSFVSRCVREAFNTRIPEDRHPLFAIYLRFPPGDIDVNVHPQKKEVRFCNEVFLYSFIQEALQESFLQNEYARKTSSLPLQFSISSAQAEILPWELQAAPYGVPSEKEHIENQQTVIPQDPSELEVIGLFDKYLLVMASTMPATCPLFFEKKPEGLVLIDLSLAKMRIAYEEIMLREQNSPITVQRLLIPRKIALSRQEALLLQKKLADLLQIGLEIQIIGEKEFLIEGIPPFLEDEDIEEALMAGLEESRKESREQNLLHRLALRTSTFARWNKGSLLEAKGVVGRLLSSKEPYFSPRGKSIIALLNSRDLERLFYTNYVS